MSLTITNYTTPVLHQAHTGQVSGEIKDNVLDALANQQQQINTRIDNAVAGRTEQLGQVQQFAEDNGYGHLANLASKSSDLVNNTGQRIAEHVERRFNTAETIIQRRPDGGYEISEEQGEALIGKLDSNAEAAIAALDAKSAATSERLAELEKVAVENGYEGDRIAARADSIEERFRSSADRFEDYSERRIGNIQSRLEQAYEITPEPDQDDTLENTIVA